jgi:uncharacterized membrane protein
MVDPLDMNGADAMKFVVSGGVSGLEDKLPGDQENSKQ